MNSALLAALRHNGRYLTPGFYGSLALHGRVPLPANRAENLSALKLARAADCAISQRQELDSIGQVIMPSCFGYDLKIINASPK